MHYIYVKARRDPDKTWNMGRFQLTLTEIDEIIAEWELGWRKDVPIQEIVDSDVEEEEDVENEEEEDEDAPTSDDAEEGDARKEVTVTVPMKPTVGQTKKGKGKKNTMKFDTEADADAMDQETINVLSKQNLPFADLGNTPKKAWRYATQFP